MVSLWSKLSSLAGATFLNASSDLTNYEILSNYPPDLDSLFKPSETLSSLLPWKMHIGQKKPREDSSSLKRPQYVTVFSYVRQHNSSEADFTTVALNVLQCCKTLRTLPGMLRVLEVQCSADPGVHASSTKNREDFFLHVVTELCIPLTSILGSNEALEHLYGSEDSTTKTTFMLFGLLNISKTVSALHKNSYTHYNLASLSSVFITVSGAWRLFGVELCSARDAPDAAQIQQLSGVTIPGVVAAAFNALCVQGKENCTVRFDTYSIGCLMMQVFGFFHGVSKAEILAIKTPGEAKRFFVSQGEKLPQWLNKSYLRLVDTSGKEISALVALEEAIINNDTLCAQLDTLQSRLLLMDEENREEFLRGLDPSKISFSALKFFVLPKLMELLLLFACTQTRTASQSVSSVSPNSSTPRSRSCLGAIFDFVMRAISSKFEESNTEEFSMHVGPFIAVFYAYASDNHALLESILVRDARAPVSSIDLSPLYRRAQKSSEGGLLHFFSGSANASRPASNLEDSQEKYWTRLNLLTSLQTYLPRLHPELVSAVIIACITRIANAGPEFGGYFLLDRFPDLRDLSVRSLVPLAPFIPRKELLDEIVCKRLSTLQQFDRSGESIQVNIIVCVTLLIPYLLYDKCASTPTLELIHSRQQKTPLSPSVTSIDEVVPLTEPAAPPETALLSLINNNQYEGSKAIISCFLRGMKMGDVQTSSVRVACLRGILASLECDAPSTKEKKTNANGSARPSIPVGFDVTFAHISRCPYSLVQLTHQIVPVALNLTASTPLSSTTPEMKNIEKIVEMLESTSVGEDTSRKAIDDFRNAIPKLAMNVVRAALHKIEGFHNYNSYLFHYTWNLKQHKDSTILKSTCLTDSSAVNNLGKVAQEEQQFVSNTKCDRKENDIVTPIGNIQSSSTNNFCMIRNSGAQLKPPKKGLSLRKQL